MRLENRNLNRVKCAVLTGVNKNESLNSVLSRYYSKKQDTNTTQSTILQNPKNVNVDSDIIEYILNSNKIFNRNFSRLFKLLNFLIQIPNQQVRHFLHSLQI